MTDQTQTSATRQIIQTYVDRMRSGDFAGAFGMFAPNGTYTIIGDTPASKTYVGAEGVMRDLAPLLGEGFHGAPAVNCDELIVEGDRGVALGSGGGPARYGQYTQRHYAFVFKVGNGQIVDLVEFMHPTQLSVNVFGQTLSPLPA